MIEEGEAELICDLAETYRIYDYRQLPIQTVAIFACGLKEDARIWHKMGEIRNIDRELLVLIYDRLNWLVWAQTEDGHNNINRPESLYLKIYGKEEPKNDTVKFQDAEDFRRAWAERMSKYGNDNS